MSETWKQWEGRTVEGRFLLERYLGGSDHSAVFLTSSGAGDSREAAIKLIAAGATDPENQLMQWKAARELKHPNLIRIFDAGACELDGVKLLYVVEEYAEENLSQILPERALTAEEARGMLPPVLRALQYVQDKGLVHGRIQPSNILAVGDQVKLSSDAWSAAGSRGARSASAYDPPEASTGATSAAADVWQLGMTLVEVLTQRLPSWDRARPSSPVIPAVVSGPLREIAANCLQVDAGKRWTVAEINDRLEGKRPAPSSTKTADHRDSIVSVPASSDRPRVSATWRYLVALAAVVAIVFILIPKPKPPRPTSEVQPELQSTPAQTAAADESRSAKLQAAQKAMTSSAATVAANTNPAKADNSGVVRQVTPQVSPSARRSIQGKIKVRVKVEVDAAGNVAKATLESAGPSKYFSRISLEAARDWKFSPAPAGESGVRTWKLQFAFSRGKTEASVVRAKG
jgi:TonB family protein